MKVKVGDTVYDGDKEPVMVILTDKDKENIRDMLPTAIRYCMYPTTGWSQEDIVAWMERGT
ncbi:MAG: hypothetical protein MUP73_04555 [Dehalococcoidia bacterium]|nr:hypothetical protein [Dehalococcoidia bacterium]